ncbi:MAG: acetolactate synthase [Anaerotruncus sp.]|nr:acetolactate synthase [Anaerotruncus sp.]
MVIKQLSVFVENQWGKMAEITKVLAEHDIDIRALSIADTTDFGILRLIVNHPSRAENALREQGFTVSQTEVIAVGVEDVPGGLSTALTVLKDAQIAVEYMYAFVSKEEKTAYVILRVEDNAHAENVLRTHDIKILSGDEIY